MTFPVFIGHDSREDEAYRVCRYSIYDRAVDPVEVRALKHRELRRTGLFSRPWRIGENGEHVDERDGKPFSTEFSHSRFLVPVIADRLGLKEPWALFCDCDFLFRADIGELSALADPRYAVMVVKHEHAPAEGEKMDGVVQARYARKNWSSLILWNLAVDLARPFEGLRLAAYHNVAGFPTQGYGRLLSREKKADLYRWSDIDRETAERWLEEDLARTADSVERLCPVELTDTQFAALTDFAFNGGSGNLQASVLRQAVLRGDLEEAVHQFGRWIYAGGVKFAGSYGGVRLRRTCFRLPRDLFRSRVSTADFGHELVQSSRVFRVRRAE